MNPKLMALMKSRRAGKSAGAMSRDMMPKGAQAMPKDDAMSKGGAMDERGSDYHHEQCRRHLEKGLNGTRRSAKLHLKMAKYHHDCACGMMKPSKS